MFITEREYAITSILTFTGIGAKFESKQKEIWLTDFYIFKKTAGNSICGATCSCPTYVLKEVQSFAAAIRQMMRTHTRPAQSRLVLHYLFNEHSNSYMKIIRLHKGRKQFRLKAEKYTCFLSKNWTLCFSNQIKKNPTFKNNPYFPSSFTTVHADRFHQMSTKIFSIVRFLHTLAFVLGRYLIKPKFLRWRKHDIRQLFLCKFLNFQHHLKNIKFEIIDRANQDIKYWEIN